MHKNKLMHVWHFIDTLLVMNVINTHTHACSDMHMHMHMRTLSFPMDRVTSLPSRSLCISLIVRYVRLHVCIYVCSVIMHARICVCMFIYTYVYIYIHESIYVCMLARWHVYLKSVPAKGHYIVHVSMFRMYAYLYVYIYSCTYGFASVITMHLHVHIYSYTNGFASVKACQYKSVLFA